MKKDVYIWLAVFLVGIILLVYGSISRPEVVINTPTPAPSESAVPSVSGATISKTPIPTETGFAGFTGLKAPASCLVAGEIIYLDKNTYSSADNTIITWKNVDSTGRLINWRSEPKDNLSIGPNLFANLDIPDGSYKITVGLPGKPLVKEYILFASVTYGQLVNGNVEVKEVDCAGQVKVKLSF